MSLSLPPSPAKLRACYGAGDHRWSDVMWSPFYACHVKACSSCGLIVKAPRNP